MFFGRHQVDIVLQYIEALVTGLERLWSVQFSDDSYTHGCGHP